MKVLPFLLLICFGCVTPLDNILLENATECQHRTKIAVFHRS
jgi:hypothetical protein